MTVEDRFRSELVRTANDPGDVRADDIARACAIALDTDGAELSYSLTSGRRLPLGASDETAALAVLTREVVQAGDGRSGSGRGVGSVMVVFVQPGR